MTDRKTTTRTVFIVQGLYGTAPSNPTRIWKDWLSDEFPTERRARRAWQYYKPDPNQQRWDQPSARRIVKRTISEEVVA